MLTINNMTEPEAEIEIIEIEIKEMKEMKYFNYERSLGSNISSSSTFKFNEIDEDKA